MSHFYATIPTSARRHVASACGHKSTGISTVAASYAGAIQVDVWYDKTTGKDRFEISQTPWENQGIRQVLAFGFLGNVATVKAGNNQYMTAAE